MKKLSILLTAITSLFILFSAGCGKTNGNHDGESYTKCNINGIEYDDVVEVEDPDLYASEVSVGATSNNASVDNGIIISPYFTLTVDGVQIPLYATRCGQGIHSFASVIVEKRDKNKKFSLDVVLTAKDANMSLYERNPSVVVLPEKRGIKATIKGDTVSAKLNDYGSFTFGFNNTNAEGVTVYLYEKDELNVPEGWATQEINPGRHSVADTTFTNSNTVYVFKRGRHLISSVNIATNSWVYLEDGAYLEAYPEADEDGKGEYLRVFECIGGENIKLFGHGVIDFSANDGANLTAGTYNKKGVFGFYNCKNFVVEDIVSINGNSWTLCFTDCEKVYIEGIMLYGYRTYSDGIMLSDCRDSYVTKCFVRTGDDAMETKSTSQNGYTKNVTYYDNDCWLDKGLGYGVVWETNHDVQDVYFKNCSVGFAMATWHKKLGAIEVRLGDHNYSVKNVYFEDIEIYRCDSQAVINIGLEEEGEIIDKIYFKNIVAKNVSGYMFRLWERNITANGTFGNFYLDGLYRNGVKLTADNIYDKSSYMTEFVILNSAYKPQNHIFLGKY